jgi:mono/diheme cytochrome c family protein
MQTRTAALLALSLLALPAAAPIELPQGWTVAERELWWNSPQGSRIMPYDWFLKLEQTDSPDLFVEPGHMAQYGYLPSSANAVNPDALPIGFAKERDRANAAVWVGMTCAACHTGSIAYQGKTVLIEGAGGAVDTQAFDRDMVAALTATASDDARYGRFADRLGVPPEGRAALREQVTKTAEARAAVTAMNTPPHPFGPGRVDALGDIMNAIAATALDKPGNARAPDAPVRLPWVWNAVGYSRGQYNGSVSNAGLGPVLRNIGQALGVYGMVDVGKPAISPAGAASYPTSVNVPQLEVLEALLRKMEAPTWPAEVLPPIDKARAAQGAAVFAQACASCHEPKPKDANGLVPTPLVPLDQIGTDPRAARNFMTRPAETGVLEGRPVAVFAGPVFGPRAGAATIVGHVSTAVAMQVPKERLQQGLAAYRQAIAAEPGRLDAYKAIPLAGAWAGAPYLHNGSVANMQELLTAPPNRAVRFTVGGRDFDPALLGYPATETGPGYVLDTTLPGNSNAGHEYGTTLPEADKASLIEYLKTL